jgi:hypothetical protein
MSQLFAAPSIEALMFVGRAVSLIVAFLMLAWAFRQWRRASIKDTQRVFEQLDLVRSELLIMREVMHHAAHRVDSVAHQVTQETRLSQPASGGGAARGYEIAARMARNGAAKDELIKSCGLTAHEAELLIKLHGQKQNPVETIGRQVRQPTQQTAKAPASSRDVLTSETRRAPERSAPAASARQPQRSRLVAVG